MGCKLLRVLDPLVFFISLDLLARTDGHQGWSKLVPYMDGERLLATEKLVLSRCRDRNIHRSECVAGVKSGKSSWWAGERGCRGLYSGLDHGTEFFF